MIRSFFARMNLARWILLVAVLGSVALAVSGWKLRQRRLELEAALERQVPALAQELQSLSIRYSKLLKEKQGDKLVGLDDPQTYIRSLASDSNVLLGSVMVSQSTTASLRRDVIDKRYVVKPQATDRGFSRTAIANYMYLLEEQSRRVRVTGAKIFQLKRKKPDEFPDETGWTWEIEVTSRQKGEE